MTVQEIASELVRLCREGNYSAVHDALYAADALSIEPESSGTPVVQGREALRQKEKYYEENFDIHGGYVSEPLVAANQISVAMGLDVTEKANGRRYMMEEICVYEVKDGKIVKEQFFY